MSQRYLLDANVFITPFEVNVLRGLARLFGTSEKEARSHVECWFRDGLTRGILLVAKEVEKEVISKNKKREDAASRLLRGLKGDYQILEPDEKTYEVLAQVGEFVRKNYPPEKAQPFLEGADPILVALAKSHDLVLVTEERHTLPQAEKDGINSSKPYLPHVAFAFQVRCISMLTAMLEVPCQFS